MKMKNVFKGLIVTLMAVMSVVACEKAPEVITLSVEPSSAINFKAAQNEEVVLAVTTNAEAWTIEAPEWIDVTKGGSKVILAAQDNTTAEERLGRIVIAAEGAEAVKINVSQEAGNGEGGDGGEVSGAKAVLAASVEALDLQADGTATFTVKMTTEAAAEAPMVAELSFDALYLEEFNYITGNEYNTYKEGEVTFSDEAKLTIAAGAKESNEVTVTLSGKENEYTIGYLSSIVAKPVENVSFSRDGKRVNVISTKKNNRDIKNILYFEVNDCNPLNALEVVLEDGTPFFDAVILFAANINYNTQDDVVYLHNNPNVKALLDESDVYLQPLRKAGIKVYLGLLGNHDQAGLCQLSDWGAQQFAREVAITCKECKLDGVNIDDEYSGQPDLSNKWFAPHSQKAGDRLCYELYKALKEECYWQTSVNYYVLGAMRQAGPVKDLETGKVYQPNEYIDFYMADYGGATHPYQGFDDKKDCCAMSLQLNYGYTTSPEQAAKWKEDGFGYIMYFAYDPSGTGSVRNNLESSYKTFNNVAQGIYGQKVLRPKGVYNKLGEGKYDPEFHAF